MNNSIGQQAAPATEPVIYSSACPRERTSEVCSRNWLITPPEAERRAGIVRCGGVARIAVAAVVRPITVACSVVGGVRCGIGIGRIAIAAVVAAKAVTNSCCDASTVDCAANCAAICPPVDACNAQGCSRSSYSGFSTVERTATRILLRTIEV